MFNPFNIKSTLKPAIRIKFGKKISVNKKLLTALDSPQHIQFWWGETARVLTVKSAPHKTKGTFSARLGAVQFEAEAPAGVG